MGTENTRDNMVALQAKGEQDEAVNDANEHIAASIADMVAEWYSKSCPPATHIPASVIAKRLSRFAVLATQTETASKGEAVAYAERLATALWEKHYRDTAPEWKPLSGDLVGILTQIDNMTAALTHPAPKEALLEEVVAALDIEELAMAIEGPHKPVPEGSSYTLTELRINRWSWLSDAEKAERKAQARSAVEYLFAHSLAARIREGR